MVRIWQLFGKWWTEFRYGGTRKSRIVNLGIRVPCQFKDSKGEQCRAPSVSGRLYCTKHLM